MIADLTEAIRIQIRYDTPDENGQTRRDRNTVFGQSSPLMIIEGQTARRLWNWYDDLNKSIRRVRDGASEPIPPSEIVAWCNLTDNDLHFREYEVLREMDKAYCVEMNSELSDYQLRQQERMKNGGK